MKKKTEKRRKTKIAKELLSGIITFAIMLQTVIFPAFALDTENQKQVITAFEGIKKTVYIVPLNADEETKGRILTFPDTLMATVNIADSISENKDEETDDSNQESLQTDSVPTFYNEEQLEHETKDFSETVEAPRTEIDQKEVLSEQQTQTEKRELDVIWKPNQEIVTTEKGEFIYTSELTKDDYIIHTEMPQITVIVQEFTEENSATISELPEAKSAPSLVSTEAAEDELQALHKRIQNLSSPNADEADDVVMNEKELKLDIGDVFQLELVGDDGVKKDGVEWFCRTRYPSDTLYTANSSDEGESCCSLSNNGFITAKKGGILEVWAKWGNALHMCDITVRTKNETFEKNVIIQTEQKAEEIVKDMMHLSDVDKVLAVHDYLVTHVEYTDSYLLKGAYGALLEGKAVCMGYSQAFQKLINKLNIEGGVVIGDVVDGKHAWNKVKLNGKWYYLDVTWDDQPSKSMISYKYFLIDRDTLGKDHKNWYYKSDEITGLEYRYYPYKKMGILADDQDQLKAVFSKQFNSSNSNNIKVKALVPKRIDRSTIKKILGEIAGRGARISEVTGWTEYLGDYTLYVYNIRNIKTAPLTNVKFIDVKSGNGEGETTTKLILTFDKDIDNLSANDIILKDFDKGQLTGKGNGIYELAVSNIVVPNGMEIEVEVNKRGFEISPKSNSFHISVVKEPTPTVAFEAIDNHNGILHNLEEGMKYTVRDGVWHNVTSTNPILVKTIYQCPILVIKTSSSSLKIDSDVQRIAWKKPNEPNWISTVDCTGNNQNGKIINVNKKMEYQKKGDSSWIACTGREVIGLSSGEYYVRYKVNGDSLASENQTVNIGISALDSSVGGSSSSDSSSGGSSSSDSSPGGSSSSDSSSGGSSSSDSSSGGSSSSDSSSGDSSSSDSSSGGSSSSDSSSGGSSSSGGGSRGTSRGTSKSSNITTIESSNLPTQATITIKPSVSYGTANIAVLESDIRRAITKAQADAKNKGAEKNGISVVIKSDTQNTKAQNLSINLPRLSIDTLVKENVKETCVNSGVATISLNLETLKEIQKQVGDDVTVTAQKANNNTSSEKTKSIVGNRPVFELSIIGKNGTTVKNFGRGKVFVSIPYTLGVNEKERNLVAYYIDANGSAQEVPNSIYDIKNETLMFVTDHFSKFAVGYKENNTSTFEDITNHWAKESIEFVSARGLLRGTGNGKFSPNDSITRGMSVTALSRRKPDNTKDSATRSFSDVKAHAYYIPYVEWASKNNIVKALVIVNLHRENYLS